MIGQNFSSVKFCGIWCDFWAITPEQIAQIFKHVWKREFTEDEVFQIGERVWNLGRLFNLREGMTSRRRHTRRSCYSEEGAHTTGAVRRPRHRHRDVQEDAAGVLPDPRLGRERRTQRSQTRRARRRRAPLGARRTKENRCLT